MASRGKLLSLDAFAKTVEDARIKTASGGVITLICIIAVLVLIRNEYLSYKMVINRPEVVMNRDFNSKLPINIDITFPNIPCDLFSPHVVDVSGYVQLDISGSGFKKYRILPNNEMVEDTTSFSHDIPLEKLTKGLDADGKCGSCYSALDQTNNENCCNSCQAVQAAYAYRTWAFFDGANIDQCESEGYVSRINQHINDNEGCRIKGTAMINRISGNLHFSPGNSRTMPGNDFHDLSLYNKFPEKFNFDHRIDDLSFGDVPYKGADSNGATHYLKDTSVFTGEKQHVTSYFLHVVGTRYEFLDKSTPLETNQFSVTFHHRPLYGGKDGDHQHTLHSRGGLPGVFFHFDISPIKIINREEYAKTWSGFILGVFTSVAGVLMFGSFIDRSIWVAENAIRGKKEI